MFWIILVGFNMVIFWLLVLDLIFVMFSNVLNVVMRLLVFVIVFLRILWYFFKFFLCIRVILIWVCKWLSGLCKLWVMLFVIWCIVVMSVLICLSIVLRFWFNWLILFLLLEIGICFVRLFCIIVWLVLVMSLRCCIILWLIVMFFIRFKVMVKRMDYLSVDKMCFLICCFL